MKPFYRDVIKESWMISRSRLFIWPLAFFASLIGIAGTFQIFFDLGSSDGQSLTLTNLLTEGDLLTSIFIGWSESFELIPWTQLGLSELPYLVFFFLLLILVLTIAVMVISSEGGLIYALGSLMRHRKTTFLVSFRHGLDKFWQIFSINLIYRLLYLILLITVVLPLATSVIYTDFTGKIFSSALIYLVLIPLAVIIDLITRYSIMYIMLKKNTLRQSFRNAWLLLRTNWIISLETSLLVLILLILAFFVLSSLIIPLIIFFFKMFGAVLAFSPAALRLAISLAIVTLVVVVIIFVTIFTAFQMSLWVGVFQKITSDRHHSKTFRLGQHWPWLHKRIHR